MRHEPESLLKKTIKFDEDFKVNDTVTIPKGTEAYVTADIDDVFEWNRLLIVKFVLNVMLRRVLMSFIKTSMASLD